jgi:hypothetical protein
MYLPTYPSIYLYTYFSTQLITAYRFDKVLWGRKNER